MSTSIGQTQVPVNAKVTTADPAEIDLDALSAPVVVKADTGITSATVASANPGAGAAAAGPVTEQIRQQAAVVLDQFRQSTLARVEKAGQTDAAKKVQDQVRGMTQFDIGQIGATDQDGIRTQSAAMLEGAKASSLGEAGEVLLQASSTMKGFDMKVQIKASKLTGWMHKQKDLALAAFNDWKQRRDTVNSLVEGISDDMYKRASSLKRKIGELEVSFGACVEGLKRIQVSIAGLSLAFMEVSNETIPALIDALNKDPGNPDLKQQLADAREKAATIDRRIGSLGKSYTTITQALPTIRLMQQNNNGLVEAMNTARTDTVAQWQLLLVQAQVLHEAKGNAEALNKLAELDIELRKQGADNSHDSTMEVQALIENGITTYETLDYVNQKLMQTMTELYEKQQAAATIRAEAENKMEASNRELAKVVAAGGNVK